MTFPHLAIAATLLAAAIIGPSSLPAQAGCVAPAVRTGAAEKLRALLDSLISAHQEVPGIAMHVEAPSSCLTWSGSAGVLDRETRRTLSLDNPHRIASNTKTFVAVSIFRLWEDGKLRLDDPIRRHLPAEFLDALRGDDYDVDRITIRHLLTHTSGIFDHTTDPRYFEFVAANPTYRWSRLEQVTRGSEWGTPYGAPGETFHYSDTGYLLLGEIVERLSGKPYARAVRDLVDFRRLGLASTWMETLEPVPDGVPERAHQYQQETDTHGWDPSLDLWGGGGIATTMRDLAVFFGAAATGRVYRNPATIDTVRALQIVGAKNDRGFRGGMQKLQIGSLEVWGHTGYWNTFAYYIPALDLSIAGSVTQNQTRAGRRLQMRALETLREAIGT
jgi:D-alanyl-D-alanine carboxypeptidase